MTESNSKRQIVVGVDGSESSIDALREAAEMAGALGVPLEAVTIWEFPLVVEYTPIPVWSPEEDARTVLAAAIREAFHDEPPPGLTTTTAPGPVARALIELSKGARMLVLGSRGHGGFVGMLLGSVSAACAEHAHCPVLVVHRPRTP
ncbi:universal stress protein [Mycetocola miduiensis]|uniref:Nucleotide-binding universal stress protein, UspA family n=1 Tax=Mycetocola miduiensis TaxID=995034 RepID=A0A1I4ZWT4_9MICO|nr:universal stress protein [Mycetocola miduiensis]SFN54583.1 Nucleotide-binding universal stress protein, UspA family [Mycetocola miduiensis]